jgi:hypothetical protein
MLIIFSNKKNINNFLRKITKVPFSKTLSRKKFINYNDQTLIIRVKFDEIKFQQKKLSRTRISGT